MITTQDKELLAKKGITEEQIAEQLACFLQRHTLFSDTTFVIRKNS